MTRLLRTACAALVLAACGLGSGAAETAAPPDVLTLECADYASVSTPLGRLSNNVWNKQAAGARPWRQCLQRRTGADGEPQYGWLWQWPSGGLPTTVRAYPEIVVGTMPWTGGPGNDSRLPRRLADTRRLIVDYDVDTEATGRRNLAASIWLTRTPAVAVPAGLSAIATEIMVWTDAVPASFVPAGSKRAEVVIDGAAWEVWAAENWGDSAGVHANRWTYVTYRAKAFRRAARYDAMKLIDDAVRRGFVSPDLYIADVELGNEIVSGSGRTWLKRFAVTID